MQNSSPVSVKGTRPSISNNYILDLLRCVVCLEYFSLDDSDKAPRLLECSLSFCLACCRDIAFNYAKTHPECLASLPCPLCRNTTLLGNTGVEGLRPNLTAIGLLDMPQEADLTKPVTSQDTIAQLRTDLTQQLAVIQTNLGSLDNTLQAVNTREVEEIGRLNMEFEWIENLLRERKRVHMADLESGFAVRKNQLLAKRDDLQRILILHRDYLDTFESLVAPDSTASPQSIVDKKLGIRRLMKDTSTRIQTGAIIASANVGIRFTSLFFNRICQSILSFGNVCDHSGNTSLTNYTISKILDRLTTSWDVDIRHAIAVAIPLSMFAMRVVQNIKQYLTFTYEKILLGCSSLSGYSTDTTHSCIVSSYSASVTHLRTFIYRPLVRFQRRFCQQMEEALLVKLEQWIDDGDSIIYQRSVTADVVLHYIGYMSRAHRISASRVRALGYDCELLKKMGYSPRALREAGFDNLELLKGLNYGVKDLIDAGYGFEELTRAGCSYVDLILAHAFDK